MHPELQLLEQRYLELVSAVQAGHLSEQDALVTMAQVTAVDGEGAVWSIDPYTGQFVRALPGVPPTPANPAVFAPAQLPPPPMDLNSPAGAGGPAPWGSPPSLTPPPAPPAAKQAAASAGAALSSASSLLRRHRRTLILVAVVLIAVVAMFIARGGGSAPEPAPAAPEASQPAAPTLDPSAAPVDVVPSESVAPVGLPTEKQVKQVMDLLASGTQKKMAPLVSGAPDTPAYLLSVAPIAGAADLGFRVSPSTVVAGDNGTVLLYVDISVGDSEPRATYAVPLKPAGKGWLMAGPATLSTAEVPSAEQSPTAEQPPTAQ